MLKKIFANTAAKKTSVFIAVFVITGVLMGNWYANVSDHTSLAAVAHMWGQATAAQKAPRVSVDAMDLAQDSPLTELDTPAVPMQPESPPPPQGAVRGMPARAEGFVYSASIPMSYELQRYTYDKCVEQELEYELVLALMWRESRFRVDAVNINQNGTQDSGIMQINDVNKDWLYEEYGIDNLLDPMQNIDAGTAMLGKFTAKYGEHGALMAYQYGETGMQKKLEEGVTTNDKITLLLNKREDFRAMIQNS